MFFFLLYSPINFCFKFLGWKDCRATVNDSSVLKHLEDVHPIKKLNSSSFRIWLNVWGFPLSEDEVHFDPLIVTSLDTPILLRSMVSMDGHITFTCFMLKNSGLEDLKNYRVKYRIESQGKVSTSALKPTCTIKQRTSCSITELWKWDFFSNESRILFENPSWIANDDIFLFLMRTGS